MRIPRQPPLLLSWHRPHLSSHWECCDDVLCLGSSDQNKAAHIHPLLEFPHMPSRTLQPRCDVRILFLGTVSRARLIGQWLPDCFGPKEKKKKKESPLDLQCSVRYMSVFVMNLVCLTKITMTQGVIDMCVKHRVHAPMSSPPLMSHEDSESKF